MATHTVSFKEATKEIKRLSREAHDKLLEHEPSLWSKAHIQTHSKADNVENNMSETFNAWIIKARWMASLDMLEEIRSQVMVRLNHKREQMLKSEEVICPRTRKKIDIVVEQASFCELLWAKDKKFQVKCHRDKFVVDLAENTCTCRVFDLTGIPCCHAVSAIGFMREPVQNYVSHWFKRETYIKYYSHFLEPDTSFWKETPYEKMLPPPITRKLRGRPQRQRRKEQWESDKYPGRIIKRGRTMHCTKCRKAGHNKSKCPNSTEQLNEASNELNEHVMELTQGSGSQRGNDKGKMKAKRKGKETDKGNGKETDKGKGKAIDTIFMPIPRITGATILPTNNTPSVTNEPQEQVITADSVQTPFTSSTLSSSGIRTFRSRNRTNVTANFLTEAAAKRRIEIGSSQQSTATNAFKRPRRKSDKN